MSVFCCCSQVLLVPAVHAADAAILHILWSRMCRNHPQSDDGSYPVRRILWTHEPVCWFRDNQAELPWLVDLGEYTSRLYMSQFSICIMFIASIVLPSSALCHHFVPTAITAWAL